jgi:hypothetical protein
MKSLLPGFGAAADGRGRPTSVGEAFRLRWWTTERIDWEWIERMISCQTP